MQFPTSARLLGLGLALGALGSARPQTASAQTASAPFGPNTLSRTYTVVDAYGNVTRTTVQAPSPNNAHVAPRGTFGSSGTAAPSVPVLIARQGVAGSSDLAPSIYGSVYPYNGAYVYCPPGSPYPAVPGAVINNYYYPEYPSSGPISPAPFSWAQPSRITNIPLGQTGAGYASPSYPSYGYPGYAGYGYPAYPYGNNPYAAYPYGAYPGYPTGTYFSYNGVGSAGLSTQTQRSSYSASFGRGGVSVNVGQSRSSSSTTVHSR